VLCLLAVVTASANAQVPINPGMSGSWYNPATPGQGMLIDVIPHRNEVVIGWFTFESSPPLALGSAEQRWLTAEGGFTGTRAELTVFNTSGGRFNSPRAVATEPAGTATLVFQSCTRATLSFALDGGPDGQIELLRLSPDVFCASAVASFALPSFFRISGEASGEDEAGNTAECRFDLLYEVFEASRLPGLTEYRGTGGGEVARTVLDNTGAGFAFFADFFVQDVEARVLRGNQLELDGPGKGVDDSRFYLNLARFLGQLDEQGFAEGEWTCGPFDIEVGGYTDLKQTVRGTWLIEPLINPETAKTR
jgi:hypothetical protein